MRHPCFKFVAISAVLISLFLFLSYFALAEKRFNNPLEIPLSLSATLGEVRGYSLHQGIDIKTGGRTGYPVTAVGPGTLARLISREYGYGNALFIDHDSGRQSVYGHLDAFEEKQNGLDTLSRTLKVLYNNENIDFTFSEGRFYYKDSAVIAYSGETGSGVPHLHLEIKEGERYLNPLKFFPLTDSTPPEIEDIYICTERENSTVTEVRTGVTGKPGAYTAPGQTVYAADSERIFFKIACFDNAGSLNRVAVYGFRLIADGNVIFKRDFESFLQGDIDYGRYVYDISKSKIRDGVSYAYFLCARENWGFNNSVPDGSGYIAPGSGTRAVTVEVSDFAGNISKLDFILNAEKRGKEADGFQQVKQGRRYTLKNKGGDLVLDIFKNSLYADSLINVEAIVTPRIFNTIRQLSRVWNKDISRLYSIIPADCVYREPVRITIKKPEWLSQKDAENVLIYRFFEGGKPWPLQTKYNPESGIFEAYTKTNGYYALIRDRVPPDIFLPPTHEFCEDRDIYRRLRFYAVDNVSRINSDAVMCIIDGESFPCKYDPDRMWVEVSLLRENFDSGIRHVFVSVYDRAGNRAVFRDLMMFN